MNIVELSTYKYNFALGDRVWAVGGEVEQLQLGGTYEGNNVPTWKHKVVTII